MNFFFLKAKKKTATLIKKNNKAELREGRRAEDQTATVCLCPVSPLSFVAGCLSLSITWNFSAKVLSQKEKDALCIIMGCSGASLISKHWMTVAYYFQMCVNIKCLQKLTNIVEAGKIPLFHNYLPFSFSYVYVCAWVQDVQNSLKCKSLGLAI